MPHPPLAVTHRAVFAIAAPMTLAHLTEPLIGIAHLAVVGNLGDPTLLAATALGALFFDCVLWPFGFLRMGTAGLAARASGAREEAEVRATLVRALLVAVACGTAVLLLAVPIRAAAVALLGGSDALGEALGRYVGVRILSAPFVFLAYALLGWLVGRGRTGLALAVQAAITGCNVGLSILFARVLDYGIVGVAWATVAAEVVGVGVGLLVAWRLLGGRIGLSRAVVADRGRLRAMLGMNRDIMIRSVLLLAALLLFGRQGAGQGDTVAAANGILMNLWAATSYFLDGFATAAEQICGRAVGARDPAAFRRAARLTALWALVFGAALCLLLLGAGGFIVAGMAAAPEVRATAAVFLPYAALAPLLGATAFQLDGLYIGAGWTRAMRDMMLVAFAAYVAASLVLAGPLGNHGLWIALLVFLAARGLTLALRLPRETRRSFAQPGPAAA